MQPEKVSEQPETTMIQVLLFIWKVKLMNGFHNAIMSIQNLNRHFSSSIYIAPFPSKGIFHWEFSLKKYYLSQSGKERVLLFKKPWLPEAGKVIALQINEPLSLYNIKSYFNIKDYFTTQWKYAAMQYISIVRMAKKHS